MVFNKTGYNNLLKGNLPLLNIDPVTGKDLSEISFTQRVINRIMKNRGGYQEFRIKLDKERRYEINEEALDANKEQNNELIDQSYELPGNFDIMTRKISKDAMSEDLSGAMSDSWENSMKLQRIFSERGLDCWLCSTR